MLLMLIKDWDKCGYIGSDFKINVDRCRYRELVRECFKKINNYFLEQFI